MLYECLGQKLCCGGLLKRIQMRDEWSLACARRHRACFCICQQSMCGLFGFERVGILFWNSQSNQKPASLGQSLKACPRKRKMLCCSVYWIPPCAKSGSFLNFSLYCHLNFLFYTRKKKEKERKRKQKGIKMDKRTIKSRQWLIVKYISLKALLEAVFSYLSNCFLHPVSPPGPLKRPNRPQ